MKHGACPGYSSTPTPPMTYSYDRVLVRVGYGSIELRKKYISSTTVVSIILIVELSTHDTTTTVVLL